MKKLIAVALFAIAAPAWAGVAGTSNGLVFTDEPCHASHGSRLYRHRAYTPTREACWVGWGDHITVAWVPRNNPSLPVSNWETDDIPMREVTKTPLGKKYEREDAERSKTKRWE